MSTLLGMPDKWAVKIESEVEAVELQRMFPDATAYNDTLINEAKSMLDWISQLEDRYGCGCMTPYALHNGIDLNKWRYADEAHFKVYGYTILTLQQLKELLK